MVHGTRSPVTAREAVRRMKLKHVVITAVARDDIPDGVISDLAPTLSDYGGFSVHAGMLRGRRRLCTSTSGRCAT